MKRMIAVLLALSFIFSLARPTFAAMPETIEPQYANATKVEVILGISSAGTATIQVNCIGASSLTSAETTTYIERYDTNSWVRVDNGNPSNEWIYTTTDTVICKSYTISLPKSGEYRAVTIFKLSGTTTERITKTSTATY